MQLIAHRGGAGLRVENTLAAFEHAIELGADGAELDVHLSADGRVVVHHDDCLNPNYCRHVDGDWLTPGERPAIAELSHTQLQHYDIGTPRPDTAYARQFDRVTAMPAQRIPLLREVIELVQARSDTFFLLIEIKASLLDTKPSRLEALVDATLAELAATRFGSRAILCSFDWRSMRHARQQRASIPTWLISPPLSWFAPGTPPAADIPPPAHELATLRQIHADGDAPWFAGHDPRHYAGGYPEAVAAAGANAWYPYHRDCTAASCRASAYWGLNTAAWSVNLTDAQALQRIAHTGVHNLTVDYPDTRPDTTASSA